MRHRKNVPRTKSEDVRELQRVRNTGAKLIQAMVKTTLLDPLAHSANVAESNVPRQFFLGTLVDKGRFHYF